MLFGYVAALLISVILLVVLLYMMRKNRSLYYVIVFVAVVISNAGYLAIASARTIEEAVLGLKFTYVMGCFMPLCIFIVIINACKLKLPRFVITMLVVFSCFVMGLAMTIGFSDMYYASASLGHYNGVSYIIKEYGTWHMTYYVLLVLYMVLNLFAIVYSFMKQELVSYKNLIYIVAIELTVIGVYVIERVMKAPIEIMPFACVIAQGLTIVLIRRMSMYDINAIVANSIDHMEEFGYIVFDEDKRYIGCNHKAKVFLPELAQLKLDHRIDKKNRFLYNEVLGIIEICEKMPKFFAKPHFITKDEMEIKCSVKRIMHGKKQEFIGYIMELSDDTTQQKYIRLLNNYNEELEDAVEEKIAHISRIQNTIIRGIADIVENRDSSTGGHIKRTSAVVEVFVEELRKKGDIPEFDEKFCENLIKAAPMHDLGKITVDDDVLRKPGKYTPEEFDVMKTHALAGRKIVENVLKDVEEKEFIELAANVANYHHEKWNGQGYPEQLKGEEIPIEARVMALADVFDALVSKRCYKEKMSFDEAFEIIKESFGTHFDPELGRHFIECREKLESLYAGVE